MNDITLRSRILQPELRVQEYNKPPLFKGLTIRIPITSPFKGGGVLIKDLH